MTGGQSIKLIVYNRLDSILAGRSEVECDEARILDSKFRIRYNFMIFSEEAEREKNAVHRFGLAVLYFGL